MAYIIKKQTQVKGESHDLHYLIESYREGDKVKHRQILTMGEHPTLDSMLHAIEKEKERVREGIARYKECAKWLGKDCQCAQKIEQLIASARKRHSQLNAKYWKVKGLKDKYFKD